MTDNETGKPRHSKRVIECIDGIMARKDGRMTDSKTATNVLREYGKAIRYDWSSIDGRCVRDDLEIIADTIDDGGDVDVRSLRLSVGICPKGLGKWQGESYECDECDERDECL